ncbi:protein kinase [Actinocorallia sp. API 0066]|uniref:serine/threonine-protein kinase n=1 Tax=Actinocorallia sp. API 0066 TaxID=2896846 RepID=UPI0027DFF31F|nr:protein kinase [Actinocorallia sp. API 0066]
MKPLVAGDPRAVGRYRLVARLGAGGMGEVFLGYSPGGRAVAVKLIHAAHAADPEFRRRFRLEVEAARKVGGFHTAPVVDADPDPPDGTPWMVTSYVRGPSLADVLRDHGPLPARTLRVLGAGLAEALEAIHAAGLIHRDLKPSNILLADDGPRVIDFGIARAVDASGATVKAGTAGFMSPELLVGDPLTPASDVFALGLVLAHASGVKPYGEGPAQALNYRVVHQDPDLTGLDPELGGLVRACLSRDPAPRPTPTHLLDLLAGPLPEGWLPPPVTTMLAAYTPPAAPTSNHAPDPAANPPRPQHLPDTRGPAPEQTALAGPLSHRTAGPRSLTREPGVGRPDEAAGAHGRDRGPWDGAAGSRNRGPGAALRDEAAGGQGRAWEQGAGRLDGTAGSRGLGAAGRLPVYRGRIRVGALFTSRFDVSHGVAAVSGGFALLAFQGEVFRAQAIFLSVCVAATIFSVVQLLASLVELAMPRRVEIGPEGVSVRMGMRHADYTASEVGALKVAPTGRRGRRALLLWRETGPSAVPAPRAPNYGTGPRRPPWRDRRTGWIRLCYLDQLVTPPPFELMEEPA